MALSQIKTNSIATGNITSSLISSSLTTPAQFDNSTTLATTAFVKRALGNFSIAVPVNSLPYTITSYGGYYNVGVSSGTITLPAPANGVFIVLNLQGGAGNNITVTTPSGLIYYQLTNASSITLAAGNAGTTYQLVSDGSNWIIIGGNGVSNMTTNGYHRFPSGLILQWGSYTASNSGGSTRSFNFAFPNACVGVFNTHHGGQAGTYDDGYSALASVTASTYRFVYDTTRQWFAIGY